MKAYSNRLRLPLAVLLLLVCCFVYHNSLSDWYSTRRPLAAAVSTAPSRNYDKSKEDVIKLTGGNLDHQLKATKNGGESAPLNPIVLRQIEALQQEKAARTAAQKKMASSLVHFSKKSRGEVIAENITDLEVDVKLDGQGRIAVDMAADVSEELLGVIAGLGGKIINHFAQYQAIRAELPVEALEPLAERVDVRAITPAALAVANVGTALSQGDRTHRADSARSLYGASGAGIKIGILSDGVNSLAASKASGNINALATTLPGQAGSGDEGTAMMEIIQDLVPDAQLIFATAFSGSASMASNIRGLQQAGCAVIVDAVTYFNESPFQDMVIAQAVEEVSSAGVLYFSSAGNSGNKNNGTSGTWEGDFVSAGAVSAPISGSGLVHDFGNTVAYNTVASGGGSRRVDFFWADPLGASSNDYDLFVLNSTGTSVLRSSTNVQNGTQNPYESATTLNVGERIVVVKLSGAADRFLHLDTGRAILTISTSGAVRGHNASGASNAFCVAATSVANSPYPNVFAGGATNPVETFCSDGPRRKFYDSLGVPFTPGNLTSTGGVVYNKPDITAADGTTTSVTGYTSFFGTSAAASHAAAIAAMIKSYNPALTSAQIRTAITSTALDIEAAGADRDSGAGIVMAQPALASLITPDIAEISVEQPSGTGLIDGTSTVSFGSVVSSLNSSRTFTIRNLGTFGLTGLGITIDGANSSDFTVTASPAAPVMTGGSTTFTVQFAPSALGTRTASLHIASNDADENPFDIALSGTGVVPAPEIAVEQPAGADLTDGSSSLSFTSPAIGSSTTQTITIRNTGSADLTGIVVTKDGAQNADFSVGVLSSTTLVAGASTTFDVIFTPSALGLRTAAIHIASNDSDENPFDVSLVGQVTIVQEFVAAGGITIPSSGNATPYPSTIAVSGITGSASAVRVKLNGISHTWPDDVDIFLVSPGGQVCAIMSDAGGSSDLSNLNLIFDDAAVTAISDNGPITTGTYRPANYDAVEALPPGGSGTIGTNLLALAAGGVNGDWKLYVSDDAGSDSGTITSWSIEFESNSAAAAPELAVEQPAGSGLNDGTSTVSFGLAASGSNSSRTFTIRNPGSLDLTGLGITIDGANAGDFTVTASPAAPVVSGGTTTFTVQFTPAALGSRTASLHIASNDADENPFDLTLSGTGVAPAPEIAVEQPAGTSLTDGSATVSCGAVVSGMNSSRTFTIRNLGTANLTGLGISIDGANASDFTVTSGPVAPVAAGGSTTFTVRFTPSAVGVRTASLHIASNDVDENPFDISLSGTGMDAITTFVEDFDPTYDAALWAQFGGSPAPAANTNGQAAGTGSTGNSLWFGGNGSRFALTNPINTSSGGGVSFLLAVARGTSSTWETADAGEEVVLEYTTDSTTFVQIGGPYNFTIWQNIVVAIPVAAQTAATQFRFRQLSNSGSGFDHWAIEDVQIGPGVLSSPEIAVEQPAGTGLTDGISTVGFNSVATGFTSSLAFTIRNLGSANLTGLGITIDGANASDFTVTASPAASVASAGSTTFTVRFAPAALGTRTASLHIASNDANEDPFDISLSGVGSAPAPEIVVEHPPGTGLTDGTAVVSFGSAVTGSNSSRTFTIRNSGTANLTGLGITIDGANPGDFTVTASPAAPVASAGSTTFTVLFTPAALGTRTASLHLASNDADESSFDISLSGTGVAARGTAALFYNAAYVDASATGEPANTQTSLQNLGFVVAPFSGITAADWNTAFGADVVVIPELEVSALSLSPSAVAAINAQLAVGKGLVIMGASGANEQTFLNALRGWTLADSGSISAGSMAKVAGVPAFTNSPASLTALNATYLVATTSLPVEAKPVYQSGTSTAVFVAGKIAYLGYDWYAGPQSSWETVLSEAITAVLSQVAAPEIVVEQSPGIGIADGGSVVVGEASLGEGSSITFTIKNTGFGNLTGLNITIDGAHTADFTITASPVSPLSGPIGTTTFTVLFVPSGMGLRSATLHIANNDTDENPFDIILNGTGSSTLNAEYSSATHVPLTANGFTASGGTANFTLNYLPVIGTELRVVNNTAITPINGTFTNLAQGQAVALSFGGNTYDFVANYFGGDGNDLVLHWKFTKLVAWGSNENGALGINNSKTQANQPAQVVATTPIYGKTIIAVSAGASHSLAVSADGSLAAWGSNENGQLGDGSKLTSLTPVAVSMTGALAGRQVVAVAAGGQHSVALCADGTLVAWGDGSFGQLGNDSTLDSAEPVLVNTTGALAGKRVIAIGAGNAHSVALCSDGTVVCWGDNAAGELGSGDNTRSLVPVAVAISGVLAGKTVKAIAVGYSHTLALLTDGTVAAWGANSYQQLGNNSTTDSNVPVVVNTGGVLNGKQVTTITAGGYQSMVLCMDGTLAAWGNNDHGQLGNNSVTASLGTPQAVELSGVLSSKMITGIHLGLHHALAVCSDGSMASWGANASGQLGINTTTDSLVPAMVNYSTPGGSERFVAATGGSTASHVLAIVATLPPVPMMVVEQSDGTILADASAQDYGPIPVGTLVSRTFIIKNAGTAILSGISLDLINPNPEIPHFSVAAIPAVSVFPGDSTTFTVAFLPISPGTKSATLSITSNITEFDLALSGEGINALTANYVTGTEVPATAPAFTATSKSVNFALNYAPAAGTNLMVVNNTGTDFINGVFSNLAQGGMKTLTFNGISYNFVANYYGGTGNDLVLQWASNRLLAWGANSSGTLGNNTITDSSLPVMVNASGVLAGKTIIALACGENHSLALCSDGTLAAWGADSLGQLGNGDDPQNAPSLVPTLVKTTGVLAGKKVIAIAAGQDFSMALCADGSVATWGVNGAGQLGDDSTTNRQEPVLVNTTTALNNKKVAVIAAGYNFCLAACTDGSLVSWGYNEYGQLGDNSVANRHKPVAVSTSKSIAGVAAGHYHSLAVCTDGTLLSWGDNAYGKLGTNSIAPSRVPVAVISSGALSGKTPVKVAAGQSHSMVLCADGTQMAWGDNTTGQLGTGQLGVGAMNRSLVPVNVNTTGVLSGKLGAVLAAGQTHNLALLTDGTLASWGDGTQGQLGNGGTTTQNLPVLVNTSALAAGERITQTVSGPAASHGFCVVGILPAALAGPAVTTHDATNVTKTTATLQGIANPNALLTEAYFEYGLTKSYGSQTSPPQDLGSGSTSVHVQKTLSGLQPNTTYHYRIKAANQQGTPVGDDKEFTTVADPPMAVTITAADVANHGATLRGAVNPNGRKTTWYFRFGTTTLYGDTTDPQVLPAGSSSVEVAAPISGLAHNTSYHYMLVATNDGGGSTNNDDVVFTSTAVGIPTALPSVSTGGSIGVTTTEVTLQGMVNPNGGSTKARFLYGTTSFDPMTPTPWQNAGSGTTLGNLSATITGLQPGTLYQYRLVASNDLGSTEGSDASFTTQFLPPLATTGNARPLTTTSMRLNGKVHAQRASTQVFFDYATDLVNFESNHQSIPATPATVTGDMDTDVSAALSGLRQGGTYYYRVRAFSTGGTTFGSKTPLFMNIPSNFPPPPPAKDGQIIVTIQPSGIASGWRFLGEQRWRSAGVLAEYLTTGDRTIEFRPLPGWIHPPQETVSIIAGQPATLLSAQYYVPPLVRSGGLLVSLKPDAIANPLVDVENRAQWRFQGDDDNHWRNSGIPVNELPSGNYLVEFKPLTGRVTPPTTVIHISPANVSAPTFTYSLADSAIGSFPQVQTFEMVSTDQTKPYAYVGQLRSNIGSSTGFVVKQRVVATAAHVVFDDYTLASVHGLQWLFQRDAGSYEPKPLIPRGYYIMAGYADARNPALSPGVLPGEGTPKSQNLDVAALYFSEDAGRGGFSGFLASDDSENEFLRSSAQKLLVGYPVDGIALTSQGRMFATPPDNVAFAAAYGRTFTTTGIRSSGGNSGGPLCVQFEGGAYYPAAIYLGGSNQAVVRAIDSEVVELFHLAGLSSTGGDNNGGGGITLSSLTGTLSASDPGAISVMIMPAEAVTAGARWSLSPETTYRLSGAQKGGLTPDSYILKLTAVDGYQIPTDQTVSILGGQLLTVTYTYALPLTMQESWRQTYFRSTANTGNAADTFDFDGDGFSNAAEYAAGTNPTLGGDFFKAENPQRSGNTFSVSTAGKAGRTYTLQRSTNLASWTNVISQGPLANDATVTLEDLAMPNDAAFYRIQVTGP